MRYILFGGSHYYAHGGAWDYIDSSDSLFLLAVKAEELESGEYYAVTEYYGSDRELDSSRSHEIDWVHIFDTETREVVYGQGEGGYDDNRMIIDIVKGGLNA